MDNVIHLIDINKPKLKGTKAEVLPTLGPILIQAAMSGTPVTVSGHPAYQTSKNSFEIFGWFDRGDRYVRINFNGAYVFSATFGQNPPSMSDVMRWKGRDWERAFLDVFRLRSVR